MTFVKLLLPEFRGWVAAAVNDLNSADKVPIHWLVRRPPAAHADFARGRLGMIDGDDRAKASGAAEHCVCVRDLLGPNTVVDEAHSAEGVCMSVEGGQFARRNEE